MLSHSGLCLWSLYLASPSYSTSELLFTLQSPTQMCPTAQHTETQGNFSDGITPLPPSSIGQDRDGALSQSFWHRWKKVGPKASAYRLTASLFSVPLRLKPAQALMVQDISVGWPRGRERTRGWHHDHRRQKEKQEPPLRLPLPNVCVVTPCHFMVVTDGPSRKVQNSGLTRVQRCALRISGLQP